jgi:predicted metalloprotease with PDZ domain
MRGCIYLLQIDSKLRKISGIFDFSQMSPLDDIIVDMAKRWQRGERLQACDWLMYLRPYLGDHSREFHAMLRGAVTDLNDVVIVHKDWFLTSSLQEILDFGLGKSSINTRVVSGIVQGSRAVIAGLKNGDQILSTSRASFCAMSLSANFEIVIERSCKKVHISYWPRSFSKAEVFHLASVPNEEHRI